MKIVQTLLCTAGLFGFGMVANAQTMPKEPVQSSAPGMAEHDQPVMDREIVAHFLLNQNEGRFGDGSPHYRWSGEGWVGTDYDKFWVKTEGTVKNGKVEDGQDEFLYSRAITTYFDFQTGLRSDLDSRRTRNWASFGIEGLAPGFFNVELAGYVSPEGRLAARTEVSYDLLITNRLILQPQIELNFYSRSDRARGIGPGLAEIDTGLRLRYEITRKFAPYIGVGYEGKFGQTANFARQEGEKAHDVRVLAGIRLWF
ncbi:MAG: copper resistance protein B [Rhizobiaceae bacterium]